MKPLTNLPRPTALAVANIADEARVEQVVIFCNKKYLVKNFNNILEIEEV